MNKKFSFPILGVAALSVVAIYFTLNFGVFQGSDKTGGSQSSSTHTTDRAQNSTNGKDLRNTERIAEILARLSNAQSKEEFLKILAESLHDHEAETIAALAKLDSIYLEENFLITEILRKHFSERYTALESLNRMALLKDGKYEIYKMAAIDLLAWHAEKDNPAALVDFLNNSDNHEIASVVPTSLSYHIARQGIQNAVALIDQIQDPDMKQSFREGVFQEWLAKEPAEVAEYLSQRDLKPEDDIVVHSLATKLDHRYHATAMEWAKEISDPALRDRTYRETAAAWLLIPEREQKEEYAAWKSSITDPALLEPLQRQEDDLADRVKIKSAFLDSVDEIKNLVKTQQEQTGSLDLSLNPDLVTALDSFAEFSTEIIKLAAENPDDVLMSQEALIIKKRIATDFPKLGELDPRFQEIIQQYRSESPTE